MKLLTTNNTTTDERGVFIRMSTYADDEEEAPAATTEVGEDNDEGGQDSDDSKVYEVEEVKSKRTRGGRIEYLVGWIGYGEDEDEWVSIDCLGNCMEHVQKFENELEQVEVERNEALASKKRAETKRKVAQEDAQVDPLSEYEQERQGRISRNEHAIASLGILESKAELEGKKPNGQQIARDDILLVSPPNNPETEAEAGTDTEVHHQNLMDVFLNPLVYVNMYRRLILGN